MFSTSKRLKPNFVSLFWQFIKEGEGKRNRWSQEGEDKRDKGNKRQRGTHGDERERRNIYKSKRKGRWEKRMSGRRGRDKRPVVLS